MWTTHEQRCAQDIPTLVTTKVGQKTWRKSEAHSNWEYIRFTEPNLHFLNVYEHFTRATWYGIVEVKCHAREWAENADTHFARACAIEMQVNISEEPLYTEIGKKNAGAQLEHPDEAPAFTPTVRTPQCEHSVLGNPKKKLSGRVLFKKGWLGRSNPKHYCQRVFLHGYAESGVSY